MMDKVPKEITEKKINAGVLVLALCMSANTD